MRPLPPASPRAFTIDVDDARRSGAALCLHGYTGTPFEVRVLANDLADRIGFACHAPVLPGHEGDPVALNFVGDDDWLNAALRAFDRLDAIDPPGNASGRGAPPRIIVACSMGALLALNICLLRRVDALVLLAPALRLFPVASFGVGALNAGLWRVRPFIQKEGPGGDVGAADAVRANPSYKVMPTRGLATFLRLQRRTEKLLPLITTPIFMAHGDDDRTILPASSGIIARRVRSTVIEHHRLRHTRHLVGLDVDRDVVSDLAVAFVRRTLAMAPA